MADLGIWLQLHLASSLARYDVMDALVEVEVRNNDRERDGFQLTFQLGRDRTADDFKLLARGLLEPATAVSIAVIVQGQRYFLINGIITHQQVSPSNQPGGSRLIVTGEDLSLKMDLHHKPEVHRNLSDSAIVGKILGNNNYRDLIPQIRTTNDTPNEKRQVVTQKSTDLAFVRELAARNSFVFCIEPSDKPGRSIAYWGPKERDKSTQPPLSLNMGSATNVDQLSFNFNSLQPVRSKALIVDPATGKVSEVAAPDLLSPPLSAQPARPLRSLFLNDTAGLDFAQASRRCLETASAGAEAVDGTGELNAALYGRVLRSRHKVGVRGTGNKYDGVYYVKQVTHRIRRGEYKQSSRSSAKDAGRVKQG